MTRSISRRKLLRHSTIGATATAGAMFFPQPLTALIGGHRPEPIPPIQDDRIKALVLRGVEAAKATGAHYADVRMTHTWFRRHTEGYYNIMMNSEQIHVGVRALVDGYWGFAASPVWSADEVARLGREAVRQAKANTLGKPRDVDLPPVELVQDGHWETPIEIDPFALDPVDIGDYLGYLFQELKIRLGSLSRTGEIEGGASVIYNVWRQAKAFGSTDGSYLTQQITRSSGRAGLSHKDVVADDGGLLTRTGAGWELIRNAPIFETLWKNLMYEKEMARLPVKPVEVGRYATVFDAQSTANLLSRSLGEATRINRAYGYEANSKGTSYLIEPAEMLQSYQLGGPSLTISANRTEVGGTSTEQWDDDGVKTQSFPLIDRGVVVNYHTSRESVGWLKSRYAQLGRVFQSNGCACATTAVDAANIGLANLVMEPGSQDASLQDVEASIDRGMSVTGVNPHMDFQLTSGYDSNFRCYELRDGKRISRIYGAGILFRTSEIWKSILTIGGKNTQRRYGMLDDFSGPSGREQMDHSVTGVPIAVKDVTFIDRERR